MKFEMRLITNQKIKGNINKVTDVEFIDDFVRVKFDDGATYYYAKRLVEAIYIE